MQTDLERNTEIERLRATCGEMQTVILALLVRDGRIRISPSELKAIGPTLKIQARKDGAGALVLELVQTQVQPQQPAIVVPQLRGHA